MSGKFSEMRTWFEKGQTGLGYDHKILMEVGVYFEEIVTKFDQIFIMTKQQAFILINL